MEDGQINKLRKKPQKKHHTFDVLSNKTHKFQAILQLLHLVTALENRRNNHSNQLNDISGTRKAFNYVDAITNLMVRDNEIVAAVALADANPPSSIISVSSESENVQVRPQYTSHVWYSSNSSSHGLHSRTRNCPLIFTMNRPSPSHFCGWRQLLTPNFTKMSSLSWVKISRY